MVNGRLYSDKQRSRHRQRYKQVICAILAFNIYTSIHPSFVSAQENSNEFKEQSQTQLDYLIQFLADSDPITRKNAALALGQAGDKKAIPFLRRCLNDSDQSVRFEVTLSLGFLGDRVVASKLRDLLDLTIDENRFRLLQSLIVVNQPENLPYWQKLLKDDSRSIRGLSAFGIFQIKKNLPQFQNYKDMYYYLISYQRPIFTKVAREIYTYSNLESIQKISLMILDLESSDKNKRLHTINKIGISQDKTFTPFLIQLLENQDDDIRVYAAMALGDLKDTSASKKLVSLLSDNNASVRFYTALSLGKLGDKSVIPYLKDLFRNDNLAIEDIDVLTASFRALIELGDQGVLKQLVDNLGLPNNEWKVRSTSSKILSNIGILLPYLKYRLQNQSIDKYFALRLLSDIGKPAIPTLEKLLKSNDSYWKSEVLQTLFNMRYKEVVPILIKALNDDSIEVRVEAVRFLGRLEDRSILPALVKALEVEKTWIKQEILDSISSQLTKFKDKSLIPVLMPYLKDDSNKHLNYDVYKIDAIEGLGNLGDKSVVPTLLEELYEEEEDALEISYGQRALEQLDTDVAKEFIKKRLKSEDFTVRHEAARDLARYGDSSAIPELIDSFYYYNYYLSKRKFIIPDVQFSAESFRYFDEQAIPYLLAVYKNPDDFIRTYCMLGLSELKVPQALPALLNGLKDKYWEVRRAAVNGLGELKDKRAIPALILALKDKDKMVAYDAALVLANFGDATGAPLLIKAFKEENVNDERFMMEKSILALGNLKYKPAVIELINALNPETTYAFGTAIQKSLVQIEDKTIIPKLIELLSDKKIDRKVKFYLINVLGELGDENVISNLIQIYQGNDLWLWEATNNALDKIGKKIKPKSFTPAKLDVHHDSKRSHEKISLQNESFQIWQKKVIQILIPLLTQRDSLRLSAQEALITWGVTDKDLSHPLTQVKPFDHLKVLEFRTKLALINKNFEALKKLSQTLFENAEKDGHIVFGVQAQYYQALRYIEIKDFKHAIPHLVKLRNYVDFDVSIEDKKENFSNISSTLSNLLGQAYLLTKQSDMAEDAFNQGLEELAWEDKVLEQKNKSLEALLLLGLGQAELQSCQLLKVFFQDKLLRGEQHILQGLDLIDTQQIRDPEVLEAAGQALPILINHYRSQGKNSEAIQLLERYKQGFLRQKFAQLDIVFDDPIKQEAVDSIRRNQEEEEKLDAEIRKLNREKKPDEKKISELEDDLKQVKKKQKDLLTSLHDRFPEIASLYSYKASDIEGVLSKMPEDNILLQYLVTDQITYLFVLSKTDLKVYPIRITRSALEDKIKQFRDKITTRPLKPVEAEAQELYNLLVKPAEADIQDQHTKVGLLPDGPLYQMPFQALHTGKHYWIKEKALFSLSNTAELERIIGSQSQIKNVLAMGNPLNPMFADRFESLEFSEEEVKNISKEFLLGPKATEYLARKPNPKMDFDTLHLATHGVIDQVNPKQSFIYLAPDLTHGEDMDGLLKIEEIFGTSWPYDTVFLSACETGVGKEKGQAVDSLSHAFMTGGAKTVISSLWKVNDKSTSILGSAFYSQLKNGKGKAEALQAAQNNLMENQEPKYKHPYYWAPFVLTGDWR